ncbi:hypothetical protein PLESTB_000411800 [Pleodorina starrii]|uniref:Uncharacterized protein n=1 Tax=Pleodorina starrii TaxID=330485 RepID=A0A9W6BES5_9CHLO|nr:hypothetical protein PLESTB_000411800 [Pleodorina starrii]GLC70277.1 hypothetical protein PLESTF_000954400 [Pleodorina starrii]
MASYPKRSRSRSLTEVLCTSGEQETLRASSAVALLREQRLVFGPSLPAVAPCCGDQDPVLAELQTTQAIIFQDSRALGRLVKPRVLVDSPGELAPGSLVSLIFDYWQPAPVDRKHGPVQHLRIPLDSRYCSTSLFSLNAILTGPGGPVALPSHEWSGSKSAAAVNQHQQRLDYIRTQQKLFTEGEGKDSPNRHLLARSDAEYTIDTVPEWETSSLSLTFNIAAELPWLQRIILKLLVVPKAPVDDNGGLVGDTRAEVTASSSSVGASGLVDMASASAQPVPQGHSGGQQAGRDMQPADDMLPQTQQTPQSDTPSCAAAGCTSDTDVECFGVLAPADDVRKLDDGFSSPAVALANSGGAAGICRRGAVQSTRSAGGGGESHGSSDSEDDGTTQGQSGSGQGRATGISGGASGPGSGGAGDDGDRENPGRERGRDQEPASASPKNGRKLKEKSHLEAADGAAVEVNGLESQPLAVTANSSPAVPSSSHSHSDRDAAASLQEASSRSTTMDTVDASSDAADEQQVGVAESKPTVKLIPNCGGLVCGDDGTAHPAVELPPAPALAAPGKQTCAGGSGAGSGDSDGTLQDSAVAAATAAEARVCTSGCCGRGSASGVDSEPGPARETALSVAGSDEAAAKSSTAVAEGDSGRAAGLSTGRRRSDDVAPERPSVASAGPALKGAGHAAAQPMASGFAAVGGAVGDESCSGVLPSSSPPVASAAPLPPVQLPPSQQQNRPYPNGAAWPQHLKGMSQTADTQQLLLQQQQQHALGAAGAPHLPPHASHHGVHGHPLQNGKVRNGELIPDPTLLAAQQLLPALAGYAPVQGGSGSGTPALPAQQPVVQPHAYGNGAVDAALLHQLLLAQPNGALQLQHGGMPLHGQQHMHSAAVYNLLLQQQVQQHQAQQQLVQMFQPQYQQHVTAQHQAQHQAQQQQQLLLQGLAHAESHFMVPASPAAPAAESAAFFSSAAASAPSGAPLPAPAAPSATLAAHVEPSAFLAADTAPQLQQQQPQQQGLAAPVNAPQPLNVTPIVTPTPVVSQMQAAGAQSGESAGQSGWDLGSSASSVRSEPTSATAASLLEQRPMGPQHRVQSQGNILAAAHGGGGGGGGGGQMGAAREGSSGRPYRGRTSFSGMGGPPGGTGGGSSSSNGASGASQPSVMMHGGGGGAYGPRPFGGHAGGSRHGGGGGGGHGYPRGGGRYDGGSAESSRPSSRGPHPHGSMRPPHPADPVPPPESLPLPDHPKGSCDLDRFISQIEPVIAIDPAKPPQQALQELRLRDLWNFYFEPSLYGREVFTLGGHRGASNSYFVPYLSAIQIFTRALPTDVGGTNRLYVSEDNQGWPKHMHLKFEYFEQELPFNRLPLYDQIELLSSTMATTASTSAAGRTAAAGISGGGGSGGGGVGQAGGRTPPTAAAASPAGTAAAPPAGAGAKPAASGAEEAAVAAPANEDPPGDSKDPTPSAEAATGTGGEEEAAPTASNVAQASAACTGLAEGAVEGGQGAAVPVAAASGAAPTAASNAAAAQPATQAAAPAAAPSPDTDAPGGTGGAGTGLLYEMRLLDVHPASWFAVAWYPVYRIPDAPLYARFLTFHSFAPLVESMRNVHERLAMGQVAPYYILSLPVVGLNWYNMQGERWMEPLEEARSHAGPAPPNAVLAPAASASSPSRGPHNRGGGGGGRASGGTDVWYQHLLQNYQSTADRLARGLGLKVLGQHGAEEVRLRVPDYEFFRARP